MSFRRSQLREIIQSSSRWTRDFRHLGRLPTFWTKRQPALAEIQPLLKAVKPHDRIKYWNIVPGDQVRLRGDPLKTIHEVHQINKLNNRVFLKSEIDQTPTANKMAASKSVPYAKCQLFVGNFEFPPGDNSAEPTVLPVFATRLATSKPFWLRTAHRYQWSRYAVNTVPRLPHLLPGETERTLVPWPKDEPPRKLKPTAYDTTLDAVTEITYKPPALPATIEMAVPSPPSEDAYIKSLWPGQSPFDPSQPVEVYLHKELSNPHSRAKKQARWQKAIFRQRALLQEYITAELVDLKGRTRRDARAEAAFKWRQRLEDDLRAERKRRWKNRGEEARLEVRKVRKARKEEKQRERLRNLVLSEAPNQVLPPTVRA
ncbi:hypothetical protein B0H21DRAFT_803286 [Amylocystis lapponica]|nr:hypothetical protein B0H21DRAFT_803286 [Amylocystis lapponica]